MAAHHDFGEFVKKDKTPFAPCKIRRHNGFGILVIIPEPFSKILFCPEIHEILLSLNLKTIFIHDDGISKQQNDLKNAYLQGKDKNISIKNIYIYEKHIAS